MNTNNITKTLYIPVEVDDISRQSYSLYFLIFNDKFSKTFLTYV